jgi:hypothetical protein
MLFVININKKFSPSSNSHREQKNWGKKRKKKERKKERKKSVKERKKERNLH